MLENKIPMHDYGEEKELQVYMLVPESIWRRVCQLAHAEEQKPRLLVLDIIKDYLKALPIGE